ncbi:MAG: hypothetical protein MUF34_11035 [Polyangiaceae bacterium]|nr:hypothetical protein [Polyangiaceae bacterium]
MRRHRPVRFVSVLGFFLAAASSFAACSGGGSGGGGDDDDDNGGSSGEGGNAGAAGVPGYGASAGFPGISGTGGTGTPPTQALFIEPAEVELTTSGTPATQAFTAKLSDGTVPPAGVEWSVDDVALGLIGQSTGLFTSKSFVGGETTVTATYAGRKATAKLRVNVNAIDNPGGVSDGDQGKLETGGSADSKLGFLYPYDETVFPRGVGAPMLQFAGASATALRLLIETKGFRYEGFFQPEPLPEDKKLNRLQLPDAAWQGLVGSVQPGEQVKVSVTTLVGGNAAGPVSQTWQVARGSLKGIVYYNSYSSRLVPDDGDDRPGAPAILTIKPGKDAEALPMLAPGATDPQVGGCRVCHSVSSQGNRLAMGLEWGENNNPDDSGSFELTPDGQANELKVDGEGRKYAFGALTPDGKFMLSHGVTGGDSEFIRGLDGNGTGFDSKLYKTDDGSLVPTNPLGVRFAMTPAFSHDGTKIAFNRIETGNRSTLSVVPFNEANLASAFGAIENVLDNTTAPLVAGEVVRAWPAFLPDSKAIVYHEGTHFDTGNAKNDEDSKARAHVRMVELATKAVLALSRLNGERPDGSSYLPNDNVPNISESSMNYEPTVLPVPVGGYYWVFFTSRRSFGNTLSVGGLIEGGGNPYGIVNPAPGDDDEQASPRKKIWVAAIDLDYADKLALPPSHPDYDPDYDPSHPAFFVTGQELEAGNMRAFAALEPCRQQGISCESSTECCDGRSCRQNGVDPVTGQPVLQCIEPPPNTCAQEDDSCTVASDCCDQPPGIEPLLCIA